MIETIARKAFDESVFFSVDRTTPEVEIDGFIEVEVTFRLCKRRTLIKSLYTTGCAVCKSVDAFAPEDEQRRLGAPCTSDIHLERLDLDCVVPAMSEAACGRLSFKLWIRPPKGAAEVEFWAKTDHVLPLTPYTLVL